MAHWRVSWPRAVWAAQQPLDKRVFGSSYDDVELLGKLVQRGEGWQLPGLGLELADGAVFGRSTRSCARCSAGARCSPA